MSHFSRATKSIHNWMPSVLTVQERGRNLIGPCMTTMTKISMDIKHMPISHGHSYILVLLCEVSNYMVALPLHSTKTPHILQVFQKGYVAYFGPPTHIVCDQDAVFTSSLMEAFTEQLGIKMIMVSPTNHKSLLAEHGIKSLSNLLVKHLTEIWSWPDCLPYAMLCYNSYSTPNLYNMSLYELVFRHRATHFTRVRNKAKCCCEQNVYRLL